MHRFAVGDPQCVCHEPFADFRVWMVDGESVRQKLYSRGAAAFVGSVAVIVVGIVRSGAVFMSRFPWFRPRARQARDLATRGRSPPRWAGAISMWVRMLSRNRNRRAAMVAARRAFTGLRDDEEMPVICPTCQLAFDPSMPAACTFAWGCFRYFGRAHLYTAISITYEFAVLFSVARRRFRKRRHSRNSL